MCYNSSFQGNVTSTGTVNAVNVSCALITTDSISSNSPNISLSKPISSIFDITTTGTISTATVKANTITSDSSKVILSKPLNFGTFLGEKICLYDINSSNLFGLSISTGQFDNHINSTVDNWG